MLQSLFGPKCVICGKRGARVAEEATLLDHCAGTARTESPQEVSWVKEYGIYGRADKWMHWYYHPSCVEAALCQPEKHGHARVDKALGIMERVAQQRKRKEEEMVDKIQTALRYKATVKAACRKAEDGYLLLD